MLDIVTVGTQLSPRPLHTLLSVSVLAGITAIDLQCARAAALKRLRGPSQHDYSQRSGFPKPAAQMRGAAGPVDRSDAAPSGARRRPSLSLRAVAAADAMGTGVATL